MSKSLTEASSKPDKYLQSAESNQPEKTKRERAREATPRTHGETTSWNVRGSCAHYCMHIHVHFIHIIFLYAILTYLGEGEEQFRTRETNKTLVFTIFNAPVSWMIRVLDLRSDMSQHNIIYLDAFGLVLVWSPPMMLKLPLPGPHPLARRRVGLSLESRLYTVNDPRSACPPRPTPAFSSIFETPACRRPLRGGRRCSPGPTPACTPRGSPRTLSESTRRPPSTSGSRRGRCPGKGRPA